MAIERRMKQRDLVLSIISFCCSRPEFGRTSLQKVAYFVSLGLSEPMGHDAHFYGPFSSDIEDDVESLLIADLIDEKVTTLNFQGFRGQEARKYEYRVTAKGQERLDAIQQAYSEEWRYVHDFVDKLAEAAGGLDQGVLSAAAKTHFIASREKRPVSAQEIREFGKQLGWNLKELQIVQVVQVLEAMGLVRRTQPEKGSA